MFGQVLKIELEELTRTSHSIIKGNVTNIFSSFDENGKDINTIIEFSVIENIKGSNSTSEQVIIPGGIVGNVGVLVTHTPKFYIGEEAIVFIANDYKGRKTIRGWKQGNYPIINGNIFYEGNETAVENLINGLNNFILNGEQGEIEINININKPDSPLTGPSITSINPNNAPALRPYAINPNNSFNPGERGSLIDIYGSNFGDTQGTSLVRFYESGSVPADAQYILFWSNTHIQCKIPGGEWISQSFLNASSGPIYVITTGGTSNGLQLDIPFSTPNKKFSLPNPTFYVNSNGTTDTDGEFTAIQNSLITWSSVTNSNLLFIYGGTTPRTPTISDGYNDIGWIESNWPYDATVIGANTYSFDGFPSSNLLFESDIRFNGVNYTWTTAGQTGRMDVQNIATHELGHALNLQDLYGTADAEKTMYGQSGYNETKQRTLEPGDIMGVVYLYPTPFSLLLYNNFEFDGNSYGQLNVKNLTQATNNNPYNSPINQIINYGSLFETLAATNYTINGRNYSYAGWSDDNSLGNSRTISSTQNQNISALYKYLHFSNQTNAYSNPSQRKFIQTPDGVKHICYESMNRVWLEHSTDNGATWFLGNGGKPLSSVDSKNPSMSYYGNQLGIVWQEKNGSSFKIKIALFWMNNYQSSLFGTVVDESALNYSYNSNPVIAWGYNGKVVVVWSGFDMCENIASNALKYAYGSASSNGISWLTQCAIPNTDANSINPTIIADYTISATPFYYYLAWEQVVNTTTSKIYYDQITQGSNNYLSSTSYQEISYPSGYSKNYQPSILLRKVNTNSLPYVTWLGYRSTPSSSTSVISRYKQSGSWSSFSVYGNSLVQSFSINNAGYQYYQDILGLGWSESVSQGVPVYVNKAMKIGGSSTISTLTTTGRDIQINNSNGTSGMYVNSFKNSTLPYFFSLSQPFSSLDKENSLSIFNGREGIVGKDEAQFFFALGDISVNGQNINFIPVPDSVSIKSLETLNSYFESESFTVNSNSNLIYGVQYGITDSSLCSAALIENENIGFRVELVDATTNELLGTYDEVTYTAQNVFQYSNIGYQVNLSGIGERTIKFRLVTNTNAAVDFSLANRFADQSTLAKNQYQQINYQGNLAVTDYALEQNYPNPFNPSTTIKFQLPNDGMVTLKIYDILGNEITTLINEQKPQGRYEVNFNASSFASGVYIYKIQSGDFVSSKKMILLK